MRVTKAMVQWWLEAAGVLKKKPRHSKAVRENAVRLYVQGKTTKEVGDVVGIRSDLVQRWVRKQGVARDDEHLGVTSEVRKMAVALYKQGMSSPEVAEKLGVAITSVHNWAKKAGVARSRSKAGTLRVQKSKAA